MAHDVDALASAGRSISNPTREYRTGISLTLQFAAQQVRIGSPALRPAGPLGL
jgi:hypothetical protein